MLRSDLGPPEQEGRGCIRMSLEEGHKCDQRSRACLLQRQAEEAGVVQPGEERALRREIVAFQCLKGGLQESWGRTLCQGAWWQDKE